MSLIPVPLTEEEVDRYYEGMSNASLWPLYHDVVEKPEYHRAWWDTYVQVNRRFAQRARRLHDLPARGQLIEYDGRTVAARAFPISIDVAAFDELARSPDVLARAEQIRKELGNPSKIILGVDRLDYTKGISVRLNAFEELLEDGAVEAPDTVLMQVATPSRERVEHYVNMRETIEQQVGHINGVFGSIAGPAVHYFNQSMPREELAALYRAADVMLVTPYRDGMNLVAKEYVAARGDLGGVLVLSEFAGAAAELKQAFLVNPHDIAGVKAQLLRALRIEPAEGAKRMRAMRRHLAKNDLEH